jgi:hypothetical protein
VDNFDCYDAIIRTEKSGLEWNEYFAVNVLGIVKCAEMVKSKFTKIADSPGGVALAGFHKLVLDSTKTRDIAFFRLAESPGTLLAHEHIVAAMKKLPRPGGWGITAIPVEEI